MAKYAFPDKGSTEWHLTSELIYGIPPFALFTIDWQKNTGSSRWGKHVKGTISSVKVNATRDQFTATYAITHRHRDQPARLMTGTMKVSVNDAEGNVNIKITGMPDWRDNTEFEALRKKSPLPFVPVAGKNFEVTLKTGSSGKLIASASYGNLYVRDLDRQVEITYPLLAVGGGLAAGITIMASTTFEKVKLALPRRYWDGATVDLVSAGTSVIIGSSEVRLTLTLPDQQKIAMKYAGFGVGLDLSINWGTQQIGSLGPRLHEAAY